MEDFKLGAIGSYLHSRKSLAAVGHLCSWPSPGWRCSLYCHIPPWVQPLAGRKYSDDHGGRGQFRQLPPPARCSKGRGPRNPRLLDPSVTQRGPAAQPQGGERMGLGSLDPVVGAQELLPPTNLVIKHALLTVASKSPQQIMWA